jgi:hypothetical protein
MEIEMDFSSYDDMLEIQEELRHVDMSNDMADVDCDGVDSEGEF